MADPMELAAAAATAARSYYAWEWANRAGLIRCSGSYSKGSEERVRRSAITMA
jgi:hypothetical protein